MKKLLVKLIDWIGFRMFFAAGETIIGWSEKLDVRWGTGVWVPWTEEEWEEDV